MIRVAVRGLTAGILAATAWMTWLVADYTLRNIANALADCDHFTEEDD